MANKNLVLLSYGSKREYRRAIFCVLSFISRREPEIAQTRIIIYTDGPDFFATYLHHTLAEYVLLTPELLAEMDQGMERSHRRKVAVIDLTFKQYPDNGVLFIDTDTFFISDPTPLLQEYQMGTSYMHLKEYTLGESLPIFASYQQPQFPIDFMKYIEGRTFTLGGRPTQFTAADYNWNSGVLGLNKDFASYMPDVLNLTDSFYIHSKWFLCEQLAFSLTLQRITDIQSAAQFVLHYWGGRQKEFMDGRLKKLFEQSSSAMLSKPELMLPLIKKWKEDLEADDLIGLAADAANNGKWYFVFKKFVQISLKKPKYLGLFFKAFAFRKNEKMGSV